MWKECKLGDKIKKNPRISLKAFCTLNSEEQLLLGGKLSGHYYRNYIKYDESSSKNHSFNNMNVIKDLKIKIKIDSNILFFFSFKSSCG